MTQAAKLVSFSTGTPAGGSLADLICEYARVSNPTSSNNGKSNDRLLRYLMEHKHWSPFEMVNCCVEITTSRDISRQLLRHRSFSFQEFSQRYAATETLLDLKECRLQDHKNRQNSIELDREDDDHTALEQWWIEVQSDLYDRTMEAYDAALKKGIAKEVARSILMEGLTRTKLYVNGTIRSWIHYVDLRTSIETQKEHRELATLVSKEIALVFPYIKEFTHA